MLVLETQEQIVAAVKVQHVMNEIVEVVRLIPQECVQRAEERVSERREKRSWRWGRWQQRTVEQLVDVLVPHVMEKIVEVGSLLPRELVQKRTRTEQIVELVIVFDTRTRFGTDDGQSVTG